MANYLKKKITACKISPPRTRYGMSSSGYTTRSGAPTDRMVRLNGEKRWRRLMIWQFSNMGTLFVKINGKPHIVKGHDLPKCK